MKAATYVTAKLTMSSHVQKYTDSLEMLAVTDCKLFLLLGMPLIVCPLLGEVSLGSLSFSHHLMSGDLQAYEYIHSFILVHMPTQAYKI